MFCHNQVSNFSTAVYLYAVNLLLKNVGKDTFIKNLLQASILKEC